MDRDKRRGRNIAIRQRSLDYGRGRHPIAEGLILINVIPVSHKRSTYRFHSSLYLQSSSFSHVRLQRHLLNCRQRLSPQLNHSRMRSRRFLAHQKLHRKTIARCSLVFRYRRVWHIKVFFLSKSQ